MFMDALIILLWIVWVISPTFRLLSIEAFENTQYLCTSSASSSNQKCCWSSVPGAFYPGGGSCLDEQTESVILFKIKFLK